MDLNFETIPVELRAVNQWVLWKFEKRGNGKPTKVPYRTNGQKASSVDPAHWSTFDNAVEIYNAGGFDGIGFVFSDTDDFVGIDIDDCIVDGQMSDWALDILAEFDSYAEFSPSGHGVKIFTRGTLPGGRGRRANVETGCVEIYQRGRYFTVTGNAIQVGQTVKTCDDALADLSNRYFAAYNAPESAVTRDEQTSDKIVERATRYAEAFPAAVSGNDGHGATFRLACCLVNGFMLPPETAFSILERWNAACVPPWSEKELEHKIESALSRRGENDGFLLESTETQIQHSAVEAEPDELREFNVCLDEFLSRFQKRTPEGFPEHLFDVPGLVGEVADYMLDQNPIPNRILSLVGAIALQSVLIMRKIRSIDGITSNLFMVALAPSGGGKQAPQTCIKNILQRSDMADCYGGKVTSDSAMAEDLVESPQKLYLWDEFGRFLRKTRSDVGGAHMNAVQDMLLEVWNENRTLWKHKSFSRRELSRKVDSPCLSFLGMTVSEHFWDSITQSHLTDGFAARLMIFDTGPRLRGREIVAADPPDSILDQVKWWRDFKIGGDLDHYNPKPRIIKTTPEAGKLFTEIDQVSWQYTSESSVSIWVRAIEKAKRLALIYATSRDCENPIVDEAAAFWGCELTRHTIENFVNRANDEIVAEDRFSQNRKRVRGIIAEFSSKQNICSRSVLLRKTKMKSRELDEIVDSLIQSTEIEIKSLANTKRGNATTYYVAR